MIENYDEKYLYHGMSKEMPEIGSYGYFFDRKSGEYNRGFLININPDGVNPFLRNSEWYSFFYLLEPPAEPAYRPFETIEEVKVVFGKAIELRKESGEVVESYLITGAYQGTQVYYVVGAYQTKKVLQIKAGDVCFFAEELLDTEWTIDGQPAGVKI